MALLRSLALATALTLLLPAAAVLAAPGDFDDSFGNGGVATLGWGPFSAATGILVQPDGRIVPSGGGGSPSAAIVGRLTPGGQPDAGFGSGGIASVSLIGGEWADVVTRQPDGKLIGVGLTGGATTDGLVVRLNPDGTPDASFGGGDGIVTLDYGGMQDLIWGVVVQPDGKIALSGRGGPTSDLQVTRLTPEGTPDASFDGDGTATMDLGGSDEGSAIALQPDGKLVVGGFSAGAMWVVRLNPGGSPDTGFDGDGRLPLQPASGERTNDLLLQPDGKIVVLGEEADSSFLVTRLKPDGSYDDDFAASEGLAVVGFGSSDSDVAWALALQANGKVLVAGESRTGNSSVLAVARLQPNGELDTTFSGDGKQTLNGSDDGGWSVALQPDGRIVVGGDRSDDAIVVRLQGDGGSAGGGPAGGGGGGGGATQVPRCAGKRATIVGSSRADRLKGTRRADVIVALGGNDKIAAGRGNDVICAGDGNDSVDGGSGNDRLYGQNGKDKLGGGSGKDQLSGGGGKDKLSGGGGRDRCVGGIGKDRANCERGRA